MLRGNFNDVGGRQVHQDDFRLLQEEVFKAIELQHAGQGAFILQGCQVTGTAGNYAISGGLVFINGKVMEFSSVSSISSFPRYIVQAADVNQDSFSLEQGGSAYKRTLIKSELVSSAPGSGEFISMSASGGRNRYDLLANYFVRLTGNQTINGQKTFTSDVISNGVNVNTAINNINSNLALKANQSISITGTEGLNGGGNLSANRSIGISDGGVSTNKIANGAVSEGKLADNAVTTNKIANANVTTIKIADGNITASKIADGNVTTTKIADGNVTNSKLGSNSVTTDKISNSNVTAAKIADGNITTSKIADGNVTTSKIADSNITTAKIANASVTADKLATDALNLFRGNGYSDDFSVDFSQSYFQYSSRTYSNKLWNLTYNTSRVRPYVQMQIQAMRDSGGVDRIRLELQRSNNPSTGFVTIAYRYYRLDADSWCTCVIDKVDTGASVGSNYYRLVATNVEGSLCWMSNNFSGTIFGVDVF